MREKKNHLYVDSEERKLLLHSLVGFKNQLIQQGRYTDSNNEGSAEDAFNQLDLTEKQREVCQHLIDCRDKQDFEYGTHAYIAGLIDAFHIMAVLFPEKWDIERIREALSRKNR